MALALLVIFCAYISGSLPFGYWIAKQVKGIDIRQHGSGSTGATNVWRCVGKGCGVLVFALDLLKGFLPVLISILMEKQGVFAPASNSYPDVIPPLVALAALVGHGKSPFLGFRGGKSAATGVGTLIALCPPAGAMTFVTWLIVLAITRIVSVSSIIGVASCGVHFWLWHAPKPYVVYCIIGFIYVTWRHKDNIKRLMQGKEPKIGEPTKNVQPPK